MDQKYSNCNEASYAGGASYAVAIKPTFEVSYSHSPSAREMAMYSANSSNQGYSTLPAKLDYMISDALKDLKFEPNPDNLPAVRSQSSEIQVINPESQIIQVEPSIIVPEQQLMEQEFMKNLQDAKRITLTEIEETLILKRRIRKVSVSKQE